MLDLVVDRREMKAVIARALRFMGASAPAARRAAAATVAAAAPAPRR